MQAPAVPIDEHRRLAALYALGLLDSEPEEEFDQVVRLVQRLLDVPIATVTLIDADRQWFKARTGLTVPETGRDESFCGHTILEPSALVVADARTDERFADNPLVVEDPNIRFYAGVPLHSPDGQAIGALCAIDSKPRHLSDDDLAGLADLALLVERTIAARHAATVDELTGVRNRKGFLLAGDLLFALADRQRFPIAVSYVDVDGLKAINDVHGHAAGDQAIRAAADLLGGTSRAADVIARLGGDEFAVLLTGTEVVGAERLQERLDDGCARFNATSGLPFDLHLSVGVTVRQPGGPGLAEVLATADELMYAGRRQVRGA